MPYKVIKTDDFVNDFKKLDNSVKINILKYLFVPVDFDVKCYWKEHFGVIDVKETSKIGEIGVF